MSSEDQVGTVAEEAAKLLAAVQEWARQSGTEYAEAAATTAGGLADAVAGFDEHIATGSEECRYCPLCQVISAVRATSPEVRAHLTTAASSLAQAAAGLLATPVPRHDGRRGREQGTRTTDLEKIDVSGDGDDWDED